MSIFCFHERRHFTVELNSGFAQLRGIARKNDYTTRRFKKKTLNDFVSQFQLGVSVTTFLQSTGEMPKKPSFTNILAYNIKGEAEF